MFTFSAELESESCEETEVEAAKIEEFVAEFWPSLSWMSLETEIWLLVWQSMSFLSWPRGPNLHTMTRDISNAGHETSHVSLFSYFSVYVVRTLHFHLLIYFYSLFLDVILFNHENSTLDLSKPVKYCTT